jgi:hypothetical protein
MRLFLILPIFIWLTACVTTPSWGTRVGTYSYDEAVMDYGPADSCESIDTGKVCTWTDVEVSENGLDELDEDEDEKLILVFDRYDYLTAAEEEVD